MAGIPLRRRRGPMSAAQKAALKKAQEISARKRRGTGKPDAPTTQRMASLAKKPSAPQYPNEGPSPVVRKRRKAQPKDVMKPTAGDGVTKYQYNPDLSVAENMRLQKEFDAKKNAPKPQKPSSTTSSDKPQVKVVSTAAEKRLVSDLIKMASDSTIQYSAKPNGRIAKIGNKNWVEVRAKNKDGREWDYWLAKDQGSYRGSFMDNMPKGSLDSPKPEKPSSTTGSTSGGSSKPIGDRPDPGTMGVSQILKERKELIAKRNGEGLSKEEAARLVAIQAESALRHQNRKAGKGTGPTKVALGDKGNISKRPDNPAHAQYGNPTFGKKDSGQSTNISKRPDPQPDIKKLRADYIKARDSQQPKAVVDKAKRLFDDAMAKQRQGSGNRLDYKGQKTTDKTKLSDLKSTDAEEVSALRASMMQIADKDLMRDNVSSALKAAGTIGELVDAAKDIYWYLDEWDGMGRNTSELRREMDRTVEKLKKYSDSLKNDTQSSESSSAGGSVKNMSNSELVAALGRATGTRKAALEAELKRRKGKATGSGVRQPTFNRSTRMSGRG